MVADAFPGKSLVQLGVVTAEESRETAAWAQARDIDYLEVSIVGVPRDVERGAASLVCSGPASLFDRCKDILSVFGSPHHVSESRGAAYEFDKIMYCYGYANMLGFIQGAALARACGFSIEAYTAIVTERTPAIADKVPVFGRQIAGGNYEVHSGTVEVWAEAFEKTLRLCRSRSVGDALPAAIMENINKAMSAGHGDKEITAVFEVLLPGGG